MIMPCMNATSAGERGGGVALVDGQPFARLSGSARLHHDRAVSALSGEHRLADANQGHHRSQQRTTQTGRSSSGAECLAAATFARATRLSIFRGFHLNAEESLPPNCDIFKTFSGIGI